MSSFQPGDVVKYSQAGVIAINTVLATIDMLNAPNGISVQVASMGTTGVITPEISNDDGVTWVAVQCVNGTGPSAAQTTITAAGLFLIPQNGRTLRLRLSTATTAGTMTLAVSTAGENPTFASSQGTAAVGSTPTGSPLRTALVAQTATPTSRSNNQLVDPAATSYGVGIVKEYSIPELDWQYASAVTGIATAADTAAKAAGGAGVRNYVTGVQLQNNSATATEFQIKDGAATVLWRTVLAANSAPISVQFLTPLRGTAATALNVQAVTAASVVIACLQGYAAP